MKAKILYTYIFLLIVSSASGQSPQAFSETPCGDGFDSVRLNRIDSAFNSLVRNKSIPQAATLVIHKGEIVHYNSYGWRDIENKIPCERDDIFRLASQSKAIVVVGFMTLWERGLVQLDEPVKKYIPEFAKPRVLVKYSSSDGKFTTRVASRDITIRDLLTHTSGISKTGTHAKIMKNADVPLSVSKGQYLLKDVVKKIATLPLAHDPGEKFTYSLNTDVVGYLCEVISGKSIDVFLQESIFEPLGMTDTHFYLPADKSQRLVTLYTYRGKLKKSVHPIYQDYPIAGAKTYFSCGAGLNGTILDYGKFCQMVLNGGTYNNRRILGRKTLEMMQRNNVGDLRGEIGFGLAWDVFREEYIHNTPASEGSMRWGGMFGTDYIIDPKEELVIIFHTNMEYNGTGINFKTLMHNLVYQALE